MRKLMFRTQARMMLQKEKERRMKKKERKTPKLLTMPPGQRKLLERKTLIL